MACGGIPGSSSRHSLSPAYFMGTGGRASQMVFLRNYYVLIHCEGACCSHPLLPSYWEVTVRLTVRRECMKNREEGGLMGEAERCYLSTFAANARHCTSSFLGSWSSCQMELQRQLHFWRVVCRKKKKNSFMALSNDCWRVLTWKILASMGSFVSDTSRVWKDVLQVRRQTFNMFLF